MRKTLWISLAIVLIILLYSATAFSLQPKIGPSDSVQESQIKIYEDRIIIDVNGAEWSRYAPTGSMLPFINENCNGIEIIPNSPDDIHIGDIVAYENKSGDLIVHQIVGIDEDDEGLYYTLKGFANRTKDPEKVRFSSIRFKTIGVIC